MDGTQALGVGAIHDVPPVPPRRDQSHLAQDLQVLGHRRLIEFHGRHNLAHRSFLAGEEFENVAAPRLGNGIARVGGGTGAGHGYELYIPIWEYVKAGIPRLKPGATLTGRCPAWDKQTTVFVVLTCACCCCGENASERRAVSLPIATA